MCVPICVIVETAHSSLRGQACVLAQGGCNWNMAAGRSLGRLDTAGPQGPKVNVTFWRFNDLLVQFKDV